MSLKLVPITPEGLTPAYRWRFTLRDTNGRVLVPRGRRSPISSWATLLARACSSMRGEKELAQRQLNAQVDQMLRLGDTTLGEIAAARPDFDLRASTLPTVERPLDWPDLEGRARVLLADPACARWQSAWRTLRKRC
jgi:hypothetical protein